eukprot:jgi/Mesen1/4375/ME000221S03491
MLVRAFPAYIPSPKSLFLSLHMPGLILSRPFPETATIVTCSWLSLTTRRKYQGVKWSCRYLRAGNLASTYHSSGLQRVPVRVPSYGHDYESKRRYRANSKGHVQVECVKDDQFLTLHEDQMGNRRVAEKPGSDAVYPAEGSAKTASIAAIASWPELEFEGTVPGGHKKARLDAFVAQSMPHVSRARIQAAIKEGYVLLNGRLQTKAGQSVKAGDAVVCKLPPPPPLEAVPERMELSIVYEDADLLVVNKPAHLEEEEEEVEEEDEEDNVGPLLQVAPLYGPAPTIRPGIVHRLDKGTSGLLVVAKYQSITCSVPAIAVGRVEAPIGRDPRDRKRMAVEVLAGGGAALVEWRLETGRTHQIRVHAKYLGHPLLGDATYGGAGGAAEVALLRSLPREQHGKASQLVAALQRPSLHAQTLGFVHPRSKEDLFFQVDAPADFADLLELLRELHH